MELQVQMIPLKSVVDPEWNSRLDIKEDKDLLLLAESIKENGLLAPILVEEMEVTTITKDGSSNGIEYLLIAGSRRRAAMARLNAISIPAFVRPTSDRSNRTILNITENVHRKDLSAYELARACAELRKQGVTAKDVATKVGLSASRVYQLVQAFETLPGEIKSDWAKQEPVLTAPFVAELVTLKDPDKQLSEYKARKKLVDKLDGATEAKTGKKPKGNSKNTSGVKVAFTMVAKLKKALDKSKHSAAHKELAKLCIDFLIGKVSEIPGVIDAPATKEKE